MPAQEFEGTISDTIIGEFIPTLVCGTSGTITLDGNYNKLRYVKVGRLVVITGYLQTSGVSSPVGSLTLGNLPFAVADEFSAYSVGGIEAGSLGANAATSLYIRPAKGTTTALIVGYATVGGAVIDMASYVTSLSSFVVGFNYIAAP